MTRDKAGGERVAADEVRAALAAEPRIDLGRHPIAVSVDGDVVSLEGEVSDVAAKKLALERAAAVSGVRHIVDRVRIAAARRMTDAEILRHVCDALIEEPAFADIAVGAHRRGAVEPLVEPPGAGSAIVVSVVGGVVTLDGEVPGLAHKRLAGVLAWWVPGARDVVNGLEVMPPEEDGEEEIRDAVRLALEKDPIVDASGIRVAARGSIVTLGGTAHSAGQRAAAEDDAWCVFGVDRVVNRIAVRA